MRSLNFSFLQNKCNETQNRYCRVNNEQAAEMPEIGALLKYMGDGNRLLRRFALPALQHLILRLS